MMNGSVINLHATIAIRFRLYDGRYKDIDFVVDTGFTGFLSLPSSEIALLNLPLAYHTTAHLADDSAIRLPVHNAVVLWHGNELNIDVLAAGARPLLGTALLKGNELLVQFADSGLVTVEVL